jgi:DNA-3-methyladenine glycosylase II
LENAVSKIIHEKLMTATQRKFKPLHKLIQLNGPQYLKKNHKEDLFVYLANTVTGQQLSNQAAATIWGRVVNAAGDEKNLFDFCCDKNVESLRACGLSRNKIKAIVGVKEAFENGYLDSQKLVKADYETLKQTISGLWGFGAWSADMIAIFYFGMQDVWSNEDLSLRRALGVVAEGDAKMEQAILEHTTPYKSYLALHLWKAVDTKVIK